MDQIVSSVKMHDAGFDVAQLVLQEKLSQKTNEIIREFFMNTTLDKNQYLLRFACTFMLYIQCTWASPRSCLDHRKDSIDGVTGSSRS